MKKAPQGSYKSLSFKGIAMQKNTYTHFFAFEYWIKKRGHPNIFNLKGYAQKIVPEF